VTLSTAVTEEVAAADQGQPHFCPGCGGGSGGSCASASGSLAVWQPPLPLHEEEDPEYSDGQLGPADEMDLESDSGDAVTAHGLTRPGKRTFDALQLHPNGVENWMHTPNCVACLTYECPCASQCLQKVKEYHGDGAVTAIYEFRKLFRVKSQRTRLGLTDSKVRSRTA